MPIFRRAILVVSPALLLKFPSSNMALADSAAAPDPADQIDVRIVLETDYPEAQLKITDRNSGATVTTSLTDTSGNRMAFTGHLRKTGCITDYDCTINWTDKLTDSFRLWVTWTRNVAISLVLSPIDLPMSRRAVEQLGRLVPENSRDEAMRTYVGGRRIFWKLQDSSNRYSTLAINALQLWLSGALAVFKFESSFGREEALVSEIKKYRAKAANDAGFASRWQREFERSNNNVNYVKQFELYKTLEFTLYDDIPELIAENNRQAASLIVEELLTRIDNMQGSAADYRGVDRNRLLQYRGELRM